MIDRGSPTSRIARTTHTHAQRLKRGHTGSTILASLARSVKAVKNVCPERNGALKADFTIAYCTHKNCRFGNAVPYTPVTKIAVIPHIYTQVNIWLSAPNLLRWFIRCDFFIIHS